MKAVQLEIHMDPHSSSHIYIYRERELSGEQTMSQNSAEHKKSCTFGKSNEGFRKGVLAIVDLSSNPTSQ